MICRLVLSCAECKGKATGRLGASRSCWSPCSVHCQAVPRARAGYGCGEHLLGHDVIGQTNREVFSKVRSHTRYGGGLGCSLVFGKDGRCCPAVEQNPSIPSVQHWGWCRLMLRGGNPRAEGGSQGSKGACGEARPLDAGYGDHSCAVPGVRGSAFLILPC